MSLPFGPATLSWFTSNFDAATPVQTQGWPLISQGENALLLAPTGSGKTLAAFLACLDRLLETPAPHAVTRILYISPLKALVYDIERNLRAPLAGIVHHAERLGRTVKRPEVAIRTGDTSTKDRAHQQKQPAEIMVTTPESLYLMLGSQMNKTLIDVETVIIDEIHSLAATKRGAHLSLSLERLEHLCGRELQRVGLSATVEPVDSVARYLGGDRLVHVVNTLMPPRLDLQIVVPVPDMENPGGPQPDAPDSMLGQLMAEEKLKQAGGMAHGQGAEGAGTMWSAIYPKILEMVRAHRSTIIFVNSRGLCERLALRLNELAEEEIARSHHGSVSHKERAIIEELLKSGQIPALVATSSLELGIDMGAVDLVILVESPGSVASGLQRVGRAGHGVGQTSIGRLFPKYRGDLLECAVLTKLMRLGRLEPIRIPENPLDVLAQQIVAMVAHQDWKVDELERLIQRSANYVRLSRDVFEEVLDMLAGRYPSSDFADLRPRLVWDRDAGTLSARKGARTLAMVNAGTIPDRGLYGVFLGPGGPRVGELDEEMVHEIRPGQNFLLGATTWRIEEITRDKVYVSPAPGQPGRMPFWKGEGPGRPIELGRAIGATLRELQPHLSNGAISHVRAEFDLDEHAAGNLVSYLKEQLEVTGTLPTDRSLTVERFRDEIGDWRVCILSPFGSRVHTPWALALEAMFSAQAGFEVQSMATDDGIVLRFADIEEMPQLPDLAPDPEEVEDLLITQLSNSALFASQFRENAGRALLLPRKMPGQRTPLWAQRLKSQNLLAVAREYPSFPIILETYRSCLQDIFDVPALKQLLGDIRARRVRIQEVETDTPSPFARSLVFSYVSAFLYQGDAPLAERKAQALTLDRNLLAELLGQEELRELLDATVLAEMEAELQRLAEDRRARHPDDVHDLLRALGDLSEAEIEQRCAEDYRPWLEMLTEKRRAVKIRLAGESRFIAVEDAALYRDALGVQPPSGLPSAFLEELPHPMDSLLTRYARTHGPFLTREIAARFGLTVAQLDPSLRALSARRVISVGDFRPGGREKEWCDPEVLKRWRRRTLAKLRGQVAPVESQALARFLVQWHTSSPSLMEVIGQLEGLPVSFVELERTLLPTRLPNYQPRWLDELGQMGSIVWVGRGSLGNRDGRIALYRRERAHLLLSGEDESGVKPEELKPIHQAVVDYLTRRGACFFMELRTALKDAGPGAELEEAMEDLIWAGLVTNDLFAPLRGLGAPAGKSARVRTPPLGGRWTLVKHVLEAGGEVSHTQHGLAWVQTLLERYGLVSREMVQSEDLPGGFSGLYPLLRVMEESGKLRRGYFVEGLSAAQFAYPGAIDQLRKVREGGAPTEVNWAPSDAPARPRAVTLAATDPANPYGSLLGWPTSAGRPRRAVGCKVITVDGLAVLYVEKGARKVLTFPAFADPEVAALAAAALVAMADRAKGRMLQLGEVDGQAANLHESAVIFKEAGFREDYTGLMVMGKP